MSKPVHSETYAIFGDADAQRVCDWVAEMQELGWSVGDLEVTSEMIYVQTMTKALKKKPAPSRRKTLTLEQSK